MPIGVDIHVLEKSNKVSSLRWISKKQGTMARSNMESEYRTIAKITQELKVVKSLLTELGIKVLETTTNPKQQSRGNLHCSKSYLAH